MRVARMAFATVSIAFAFTTALAPVIQAGSVPWIRPDFVILYVAPNSVGQWNPIAFGGPADKTWIVRVRIGLDDDARGGH